VLIGCIYKYPFAIVFGQVAVQLAFGLLHTLERSKTFNMGFPNVGDQSVIWLGNVAQKIDFAKVIGTHFNNSNVVFFINAQYGKGYANMVVEVPLGGEQFVFLTEHGCNQLFGGGFAIWSGNG